MKILDGKKLSEEIQSSLKDRVLRLTNEGIKPGIAVILIGDKIDSIKYVNAKKRACIALGIGFNLIEFPKFDLLVIFLLILFALSPFVISLLADNSMRYPSLIKKNKIIIDKKIVWHRSPEALFFLFRLLRGESATAWPKMRFLPPVSKIVFSATAIAFSATSKSSS